MIIHSSAFHRWLYRWLKRSPVIIGMAVIDRENYNYRVTLEEMMYLIEVHKVQYIRADVLNQKMFYLKLKDPHGDTFETQLWDVPDDFM